MQTDQQLREAEALLKQMKDLEPLTQQEVCDWLDIRPEDFPRWAQANLERELEMSRAMAHVYRGRRDKKSVALVREIDGRIAEVRRSIRYWSNR